jgi:hypothetical protein
VRADRRHVRDLARHEASRAALVAYSLHLYGCRAKLERAKRHIRDFRASVDNKLGPHPIFYSLRRQFEPHEGGIVWRIDRGVGIGDDWSLIVADAIHNLRCALDHLAWQLAIRHFNGVEADATKVKQDVQFPIVTDRVKWPTHKYRKYMTIADANTLENAQPFNVDLIAQGRNLPHPLVMLSELSNTDKHRELQLAYAFPAVYSFPLESVTAIKCRIVGSPRTVTFPDPRSPKIGDKVLVLPIHSTGSHPDVAISAHPLEKSRSV